MALLESEGALFELERPGQFPVGAVEVRVRRKCI
jgi:hypothetical protein